MNTHARRPAVTITLDIPNSLERELKQEAERRGLPLTEYALQILASHRLSSGEPTPAARTGAEIFAIWEREGLLGGGPEIEDPVKYARELRERNQNRRLQ
jgi:hypothetical protein